MLVPAVTWLRSGADVVIATIVDSSLPGLSVGDSMLLTSNGKVEGSLKVGRLEALVHSTAGLVMRSATPVLQRYEVFEKRHRSSGPVVGVVEVFFDKVTTANFPASSWWWGIRGPAVR